MNTNAPYVSPSEARALGYAYADSLTSTTNAYDDCPNPGLVIMIGGCDEWEGCGRADSADELADGIMAHLDSEFHVHGMSKKAWMRLAVAHASEDPDRREQLMEAGQQMYDLSCAIRHGFRDAIMAGIRRFAAQQANGGCLVRQD